MAFKMNRLIIIIMSCLLFFLDVFLSVNGAVVPRRQESEDTGCAAVQTIYLTVREESASMSPDMATTAGVSIAKGHWQSDGVYYFVGADGLTIFDNGKIPTVAAVTTMTTTVEVEPLPRTVVGSRHVGGPPVKSTRTTYTTTTTTVWRAVTPPSPSPTSEAPPSFMTLYVTGPPTTITERFKFAVSQTATTDPDSGSTSTTTTTLFVDGPPTTITRTSTVGNLTVAWATPHPLF